MRAPVYALAMVATQFEAIDWYDVPLYYEIAFEGLTTREVDFVAAMYDEHVPRGRRRLLEAACGAGRLVAPLAARGFRVTGFDRSDTMLAFARRRLKSAGLRATLRRAELSRFDVGGRFDLALCTVNSMRYLLDEAAARAHLRAVASALEPGGIYIVGLHLTDYADPKTASERWAGQRDAVRVRCEVSSWPPDRRTRRERVRSRLRVRDGATERALETEWEFRTYSAAQLRGLLATVPVFQHVGTYDFDYDPGRPVPLDAERLDRLVILRRR